MKVASALLRVADLDRSVSFYSDVFSCRIAIHESDTALLLAPNGFQLYLHSVGRPRQPDVRDIGVEFLMWATDTESEFQRIMERLRAYEVATYSYSENGLTFVESCDPDEGRIIVAYPSPGQLPRELIVSRLRS
ncbi:MAG: VOC family protein [Mycobacterium sp.]